MPDAMTNWLTRAISGRRKTRRPLLDDNRDEVTPEVTNRAAPPIRQKPAAVPRPRPKAKKTSA